MLRLYISARKTHILHYLLAQLLLLSWGKSPHNRDTSTYGEYTQL